MRAANYYFCREYCRISSWTYWSSTPAILNICLTDGVLLGMDRPDAMGRDGPVLVQNLAEKMAHLVAVGQVGGRTHIARH